MVHGDGFDETVMAAVLDQQTVTESGESTAPHIHGVMTAKPVVHTDHRGRVFEIYPGQNEFWSMPVVYCYMFSVRAQLVKGWGLHLEKEDRYTLISGEMMTVLYDARTDSPTHGLVQRVYLSPDGVRQLKIPVGVWHANIGLGSTESMLVNHPTDVYHHANPDRLLLPWDSPKIPVDLAGFLPVQQCGPVAQPCS